MSSSGVRLLSWRGQFTVHGSNLTPVMSGNIFLIGMMGAGKTTLGKSLATRLHREFVDTDRALVERTGVQVATIFEIEGEEGFRRREAAVLAEICAHDDRVVATGGGVGLARGAPPRMRAARKGAYPRPPLERLGGR